MSVQFEGTPIAGGNTEPRCPVVVLVDRSYSMHGPKIDNLNQGIIRLKEALENDDTASMRVEVAMISFGGVTQLEHDFATADQFFPMPLQAEGGTPMGAAMREAVEALRRRKDAYRSSHLRSYTPWVFLITDGVPTDEWQAAAAELHDLEARKKLFFFVVGVEPADMGKLQQIAPPSRPPVKLASIDKFEEMFVWLSASLTEASRTEPTASSSSSGDGSESGTIVTLPSPVGWAELSA